MAAPAPAPVPINNFPDWRPDHVVVSFLNGRARAGLTEDQRRCLASMQNNGPKAVTIAMTVPQSHPRFDDFTWTHMGVRVRSVGIYRLDDQGILQEKEDWHHYVLDQVDIRFRHDVYFRTEAAARRYIAAVRNAMVGQYVVRGATEGEVAYRLRAGRSYKRIALTRLFNRYGQPFSLTVDQLENASAIYPLAV